MTTAVVVGGGVAGLVAARRLAMHGRRVLVLEAGQRLGGRVASAELAGTRVDTGAESFAVRGGAVRGLLDELGLGGDVVEPAGSAWVALPDRAVPLPSGGLLGIPSSPLAADVQRVLGARHAARAYADRLLPVLKVGRYEHLGPLVRGRMGRAVLDRLVAPVVRNVYGEDPEAVPVDAIAPGLNRAITATGTLSAAVLRLREQAPPGAAAQGLRGGVHRLVAALLADLERRGVEVRTGVAATHLVRTGAEWTVTTPDGQVVVPRVVVAADGRPALDLLDAAMPAVAALPRPAPRASRAVLLEVVGGGLDDAPRGTGVLVADGVPGVAAGAITHATAKWPWLAEATRGRQVVRLAYRGAAPVPDAVARADAAALLGIEPPAVRGRVDAVWSESAPPLARETLAVRAALAATEPPAGLTVVGAWTAGTGLASVVAAADAVRLA